MTPLNFEELDDVTRAWMLEEFEAEEASKHPYRSTLLSDFGLHAFPAAMREAIRSGTEVTFADALRESKFWKETDRRRRSTNIERLAANEFSVWYVRGLARRLMEEGESVCEVYRAGAGETGSTRQECQQHEGLIVPVEAIYKGHRAKYWPPGRYNRNAFSIPTDAGCHHSIRRVSPGQ